MRSKTAVRASMLAGGTRSPVLPPMMLSGMAANSIRQNGKAAAHGLGIGVAKGFLQGWINEEVGCPIIVG